MATQFLAREGGHIGYEDTGGPGPLVVLAPGMGDRRQLYRFLTPKLTEAGYRVVTTDIRGHGESSTDWPAYTPRATGEDLIALLRELAAGPAVVMGNSFTPASAIWVAAQAPELTAGIVLSAPFATDPRLNPIMRLAVQLVLRSPRLWARFYRSLYPTAPPADLPEYLAALRSELRRPGALAAARAMGSASKQECNRRLPEVRCPVLIIMGSKDPDFSDPAAEAQQLAQAARDATVVMIEAAGHYPPAEFPDQSAAALLPFLARTVGAGGAG